MTAPDAPAYLLLEDGTRFDGTSVGAALTDAGAGPRSTGEVVFTTGMSGYQESVTDPSFAGQLIVFTYPHIGNYGVNASAMESDRIHARAVIMREAVDRDDAPRAEQGWLSWLAGNGIPAISGVDTRALVRHIRDKGAMRGGLFAGDVPQDEAAATVAAEPSMAGQDLASTVTPKEAVTVSRSGQLRGTATGAEGDGPLIAAIDTGIKWSIVEELVARGARVRLHPLSDGPEAVLAGDVDAVFLANGPGDPGAVDHVVDTIRGVLGKKPVFGICMGHQLLCRAVGLTTFKMEFGHRGANHPVKDLTTGRVEITSQNHGFAVQTPDGTGRIEGDEPVRWATDFGEAELSHLNLYDRTVEGLVLAEANAATVQYHPEAAPGPNDASYLFDRFLDRIREGGSIADVGRQTGDAAAAQAGIAADGTTPAQAAIDADTDTTTDGASA
ncbi:glutamine-hydrolyzing carbamoyl-phosphate synthase small subunit [Patulibacter minatonensis]|uniref:glutamine-hydrolyzing carbamoyl-phosphate synthase small subunit n=1 Tax=Patulibacter minatonensis TaxID=298163 RepID=UPI0004B728CD|nr:glutamine-hydrolyzing carbamoyl-phosphate synthase small subunit [Patulibacter minatonensis]